MTIRELTKDAGNCVNLPRTEWLAVLKTAKAETPVDQEMIDALRKGSEATDATFVLCETKQVKRVCDLAGEDD